MGKKSGLGNIGVGMLNDSADGINALLDVNVSSENNGEKSENNQPEILAGFAELDISEIITNPNQPRKTFSQESIDELAQSIKTVGIIQPITVVKNGDKYEIIAGERRYRAAQVAGLTKVPVLIKDLSLRQKLEISLIENIQRENLNAIEEAIAYQNLIEQYDLTQEEMAETVGKSRTAITNSMRLLGLDPMVQKMVMDKEISAGHAKAVLAVSDKSYQASFAMYIKDNSLSVREAESLAKKWPLPEKPKSSSGGGKAMREVELDDAERELAGILQTKVSIIGSSFKGKIQIEYFSLDELERLLELIKR